MLRCRYVVHPCIFGCQVVQTAHRHRRSAAAKSFATAFGIDAAVGLICFAVFCILRNLKAWRRFYSAKRWDVWQQWFSMLIIVTLRHACQCMARCSEHAACFI